MLCIAAAQLLLGMCLLGIYEGYKAYYYSKFVSNLDQQKQQHSGPELEYESPLNFR